MEDVWIQVDAEIFLFSITSRYCMGLIQWTTWPLLSVDKWVQKRSRPLTSTKFRKNKHFLNSMPFLHLNDLLVGMERTFCLYHTNDTSFFISTPFSDTFIRRS
jgi:hypothetical protein